MGYYLGPRASMPYGARGGFFSGIGHFLGSAVQHITQYAAPIASLIGGKVGQVAGAIAEHPVTSAAAAAATGTVVASAVGHHYGGAATAAAPGLQVHGHLHLGGKRRAGAAPGMAGKRRRRMNVCNPRALRRAIRRAHGFEHLARKVISFPFHKHAAKRGVFKRTRKRAT